MKLYVTTRLLEFPDMGLRVEPGTFISIDEDEDFAEVDGSRRAKAIDHDVFFTVPPDAIAELAPVDDASKLKAENAKLERTANDLVNECLSAANHIEVALAALHLLIHDPLMLGPDATKRIIRELRNSQEDLRKAVSKTDLIPF